ncbi:MAG: hypothetical protein ACXW2O_11265, partial [Candidatus Aminicenantales bacterium]
MRMSQLSRTRFARLALAVGTAAVLILTVGAAPKPAAPATTVLEYKMPAGRALTYQGKSEEAQVMEIQGQSMETHTTGTNTFTFKAKGPKDKNLLLGVSLDDVAVTVTSSA